MSKKGSFRAGMQGEEAEEFMALLLKAQSDKHKCPYAAYFRKAALGRTPATLGLCLWRAGRTEGTARRVLPRVAPVMA